MRQKGYTLWLIPTGKLYTQLSHLISKLTKKYNAPHFEPHVTLLGKITGPEEEVLEKTSRLASELKLYEIELTNLDYLDKYFQCVFIRVKETKPVLEANAKARKIFGRENDPPYMPHLSLLYGNYPVSIKKKVIEEIGPNFSLSFPVRSIHLISYTDLYDAKSWQKVRGFKLNGSKT